MFILVQKCIEFPLPSYEIPQPWSHYYVIAFISKELSKISEVKSSFEMGVTAASGYTKKWKQKEEHSNAKKKNKN